MINNKKKTLVLSGINLFEGGPLSIYYDFLDVLLNKNIDHEYEIIAFVHKKTLFMKYANKIELIELPKARKNYIYRLYYEYFYFNNFSKNKKIDIWISLHDITPRVKAARQYTYCHNPSPFMKKDITKIKYSLTNVLFSYFYKYVYRINIKSATALIVQQDWIRKEFYNMFPVNSIIVAKPNYKLDYVFEDKSANNQTTIFVYAAFPRYFKNYEVICEAAKILNHEKFEIWFTLDGTENKYSKDIFRKYRDIPNIKWCGIKTRKEVFEMYEKADCLIFSSMLETWGLPISEFKETGKPIILADLPYAHETLGDYAKCLFFNPLDCEQLSIDMKKIIDDTNDFLVHNKLFVEPPYAEKWDDLMKILFC